jgi:hypothetical protein
LHIVAAVADSYNINELQVKWIANQAYDFLERNDK